IIDDEGHCERGLHPAQGFHALRHTGKVACVYGDAHKTHFCRRTSGKPISLTGDLPAINRVILLILREAQREQGVYVEQVNHKRSASMARTSSEVIGFWPGRATTTGSPLMGCLMNFTLPEDCFRV